MADDDDESHNLYGDDRLQAIKQIQAGVSIIIPRYNVYQVSNKSNSDDDETEPPNNEPEPPDTNNFITTSHRDIKISCVRTKSIEIVDEIIDLTEDSSALPPPCVIHTSEFSPPSTPCSSSTSKDYLRVLSSATPTLAVALPLIETEFENAPTPPHQLLQEDPEEDINVHERLIHLCKNITPRADALQYHSGKETARKSNYNLNTDAQKYEKQLAATLNRVKEKLMGTKSNKTTGKPKIQQYAVQLKRGRGRPPKFPQIGSTIPTEAERSKGRPAKNITSKIPSPAGVSPKRPDLGCEIPVTLGPTASKLQFLKRMHIFPIGRPKNKSGSLDTQNQSKKIRPSFTCKQDLLPNKNKAVSTVNVQKLDNSNISTKSAQDLSPTRATTPVLVPTSVSFEINVSATHVTNSETKQSLLPVENKLASKVIKQKLDNSKVSKSNSTDLVTARLLNTTLVPVLPAQPLATTALQVSMPFKEKSEPVMLETVSVENSASVQWKKSEESLPCINSKHLKKQNIKIIASNTLEQSPEDANMSIISAGKPMNIQPHFKIKTEKVDSSNDTELMGDLEILDTLLLASKSSVPVIRKNNLCQLDFPHVRITWNNQNLGETSTIDSCPAIKAESVTTLPTTYTQTFSTSVHSVPVESFHQNSTLTSTPTASIQTFPAPITAVSDSTNQLTIIKSTTAVPNDSEQIATFPAPITAVPVSANQLTTTKSATTVPTDSEQIATFPAPITAVSVSANQLTTTKSTTTVPTNSEQIATCPAPITAVSVSSNQLTTTKSTTTVPIDPEQIVPASAGTIRVKNINEMLIGCAPIIKQKSWHILSEPEATSNNSNSIFNLPVSKTVLPTTTSHSAEFKPTLSAPNIPVTLQSAVGSPTLSISNQSNGSNFTKEYDSSLMDLLQNGLSRGLEALFNHGYFDAKQCANHEEMVALLVPLKKKLFSFFEHCKRSKYPNLYFLKSVQEAINDAILNNKHASPDYNKMNYVLCILPPPELLTNTKSDPWINIVAKALFKCHALKNKTAKNASTMARTTKRSAMRANQSMLQGLLPDSDHTAAAAGQESTEHPLSVRKRPKLSMKNKTKVNQKSNDRIPTMRPLNMNQSSTHNEPVAVPNHPTYNRSYQPYQQPNQESNPNMHQLPPPYPAQQFSSQQPTAFPPQHVFQKQTPFQSQQTFHQQTTFQQTSFPAQQGPQVPYQSPAIYNNMQDNSILFHNMNQSSKSSISAHVLPQQMSAQQSQVVQSHLSMNTMKQPQPTQIGSGILSQGGSWNHQFSLPSVQVPTCTVAGVSEPYQAPSYVSSLSSIPQQKEAVSAALCSEKNYQLFSTDNCQSAANNQMNADSTYLQSSRFASNYTQPSDAALTYPGNDSYSLQTNTASRYQQNISRPLNLTLPTETTYLQNNQPASSYSSGINSSNFFQNLYKPNPIQQSVTVPENYSQTKNICPSTAGAMSVIQRTTNINFNIFGTANAPDIPNQSYGNPNERQNCTYFCEQPLSVNEVNSSSMSPTLDKDGNKVGHPTSITSSLLQQPISVPVVQSSSKTPDFENANTSNISADYQLPGKNHCYDTDHEKLLQETTSNCDGQFPQCEQILRDFFSHIK